MMEFRSMSAIPRNRVSAERSSLIGPNSQVQRNGTSRRDYGAAEKCFICSSVILKVKRSITSRA